MSAEIVEQTPAERQQAWLRRLCGELLKLEPLFPFRDFLHESEMPAWVEKLESEVGDRLYPVARLKENLELTPRRMGAVLGHMCAFGVWMIEALASELARPQDHIDLSKYTPEQVQQAEQRLIEFTDVWYPALRRLAKRALCSAVDQSYADMTEFLLAYAQAFARKPTRLGMPEVGSTAFRIQFFLLNYWRFVNGLKSVHELHTVLVKVFGPYQTGDQKRIEKICQRIGLSYRKPGRPRKLKIIPTPA